MRRRLVIILTALVISLVISTPHVFAAYQYTFKGYGYGHGIGMCQWGAKGRADAGQTYRQILAHYFQGTTVTSNYSVPSTVRVRLFGSSNLSKAYIEGEGSSTFDFVKTDGTYAFKGATGKWAVVPATGGLLTLVKPDGTVAVDQLAGPIIVTDASNPIEVYNAGGSRYHSYKGSLYVYPVDASHLYLVNYVGFEPEYVNGLGEVPSSWPYDALYAQAVAARTYAVKFMKPQNTFDLYDSVQSQVYIGVDKINETSGGTNWGARWAKAVADTKGQVITYSGAPIAAYYFSSCGGHTENVELAWPNASPQPYLKGAEDRNSSGKAYCQQTGNTSFSWTKVISKTDFESKLGVSGIANLVITKYGVSPRISQIKIVKADGSATTMRGDTFRSKLSLKSTWIYQMGGTFPDVSLNYWAFTQIEDLVKRGVIAGYSDGTFKPDEIVTRGQFAKMLCLAQGIPTDGSNTFTDVKGHWAESYISALVTNGIIGGYPDGTFRPEARISRAEICSVIARAMDLSPGSNKSSFPDIEGHWAKNVIQLIASNGIVTGYTDGNFKPNASANRAEVSVIIYRTLAFAQ